MIACQVNNDCPSCSAAYNCQWCTNSGCQAQGAADGCITALSCDIYCNQVANGSCSKCIAQNGCGWCSQTSKCVDSSKAGCLLLHTCPICDSHKYCEPCTDDTDCQWCGDTKTCQTRTASTNCLAAHSCPTYCKYFTSCGTCRNAPGCGWCNDNQECTDILKGTCKSLEANTCGKIEFVRILIFKMPHLSKVVSMEEHLLEECFWLLG
jgi:hypothetical protein